MIEENHILVIEPYTGAKREVRIGFGTYRIGRGEGAEIRIEGDAAVSTFHASLEYSSDGIKFKDLGSRNGSFVNGKRVDGIVVIKPDDHIIVGRTKIKVMKSNVPEGVEKSAKVFDRDKSSPQKDSELSEEELEKKYRYDPFKYIREFLAPIKDYLDSSDISEIMINGPDRIYIEKKGRILKTDRRFTGGERALLAAVKNIALAVGKDITRENPRLDARLDDGSRVCAVIAPCARDAAYVSIRKFSKERLTLNDLIRFGAITPDGVEFLDIAVKTKKNIIVSGGTGSGKTTLLNLISSLIPENDRIIVIEDTSELQLQQEHVLRMEAQKGDDKGRGRVTIRDLLHSTLRLRPDRIVIGEIRGEEAFDLLQAMNTGHGGSMSTIHSNSPIDTLRRLENTTLQAGFELPLKAIREQIASAIHLIVHTSRYHDGSRKVSHITEIQELDRNGNYVVNNIMVFKQKGFSQDGGVIGTFQPTGEKSSILREAFERGYKIDVEKWRSLGLME